MAKARLLVANDDPDLVEAMRLLLVEDGYEVETMPSRDLDVVVAMSPDLLLVDCPPGDEKNVLNFIQRVRFHQRTARLPILLGTTSLRHVEPAALRDKGISVLVRPFEIDELLHAVHEMLALKRQTAS